MGLTDSFKSFYLSLEDKYYAGLDWLDSKGIPVYSVVDAIESANIPSFPIFILIALLLVGGIGFWLFGAFSASDSAVTLTVVDEDDNPIAAANVVAKIRESQTDPLNSVSSVDGVVNFKVPSGTIIDLTVSKQGFIEKKEPITPTGERFSYKVSLEADEQTQTKVIRIVSASDGKVWEKPITLRFSCSMNSAFSREVQSSNGNVTVNGIPQDCGTLLASIIGAGFTLGSNQIDLAAASPTLSVSEENVITGTVKVTVKDEGQKPVGQANVTLYKDNATRLTSKATGETGIVTFENVPIEKYFIQVTDLREPAKYAKYDSSVKGEIKDVLENQTTEFVAVMEEKVLGKIILVAKDSETLKGIPNVSVTLFENKIESETKSTNADGKVEFFVSDTTPVFAARFDHQAYLVLNKSPLSASDSAQEVFLEKTSAQNANSAEITVVDQDDQPVENAKIVLKKLDGSIASETLSTSANGKVVFTRLQPETFFAFVSKDGIGETNSDTFVITERQQTKIKVTLQIGSGEIEVLVSDPSLQAVSGATVKAIDIFSGAVLQTAVTQSDGKATVSLRADKKAFFEVTAGGFAPGYSIAITPSAQATRTLSVSLYEDISKFEVRLEGLFVDGESIQDGLIAGEEYTAKLTLLIPENAGLDEAGVHVRTGRSEPATSNLMESDYAFIGKVFSAASTSLKGTTFSPPNGYGEDAMHLTNGNAKWTNLVFAKPKAGAYAIETKILVRENAPLGTNIEFNYRAWGKTGAIVRFPVDKVLGENESAQGKQGLYAVTSTKIFSVGPSTLCSNNFCSLISIKDLTADLQTGIIDSYPAQPLSDYRVYFTIINNGQTSFGNVQMELSTLTGGVSFGDWSIADSQGVTATGDGQNQEKIYSTLNDFTPSSTILGNAKITTQNGGTSRLLITIKSGSQSVFQKIIDFEIEPTRDLNIDVLPKNIVAFINNDLLIHASDKNASAGLPNVTIEILQGTNRIASGQTDSSGVFRYTLQSPSPGSEYTITAQKPGYRKTEQVMKVSSSILDVIPSEINESLTTTGIFSVEKELLVTNRTPLDLVISEIRFNHDFNRFVRGRFAEQYTGVVLKQGIDQNVIVIIELTDEGKRLLSRTDIAGSLTIYISDAERTKTWATDVPVIIHVGFGGEVIDNKCLIVSPAQWAISSSGASQTTQISVDNKCRAESNFVPLQNLEAKVAWKSGSNEIGTLALTSTGESAADDDTANLAEVSRVVSAWFEGGATLTQVFKTILSTVNPNTQNGFDLVFAPKPGIVSGTGTAVITIRGHHPANNGEQLLSSTLEVPVNINDLSQCITLTNTTGLTVNSTAPGLGSMNYGNYGYGGSSSLGLSRFDYGGANDYYSGYNNGTLGTGLYGGYGPGSVSPGGVDGNPTLVDYPERINATNYPYAGYSEPFYDTLASYQGTSFGMPYNYGGSWRGQTNTFGIQNNCTIPVQINLDADRELLVNNNKFSLTAGSDKTVEVQSSYFYGSYKIDVTAKAENSSDAYQTIGSVPVEVAPAGDPSRYRDCIKISKTKFQFNDMIQKPLIAKVYNSCYGEGVRLDYDSVAFSNHAYGEQQAQAEGVSGLVAGIEAIDLSVRQVSGTRAEQVLEFEIYKNMGYRDQSGFPASQMGGSEFQGMRVWATNAYNRVQAPASLVVRYSAPEGYEQRKVFRVTIEDYWSLLDMMDSFYQGNPYIHPQACIAPQALDFAPCLTEADFGGKNTYTYSPRSILNVGNPMMNGMNGSGYQTNPYGVVGNPSYGYNPQMTSPLGSTPNSPLYQASNAPTAVVQPYPYYNPAPTVSSGYSNLSSNVCGSGDSVMFGSGSSAGFLGSGGESSMRIDRQGLRVSVESVGGGGMFGGNQSQVKVTINKENAKKGKTEINETIHVQIRRQTPLGTYDVSIPIHICVELATGSDSNGSSPGTKPPAGGSILGPSGQVPGATPPVMCSAENGSQTGEAAWLNAGLHLLNFDWSYEGINQTQCDYVGGKADKTNTFCDAVQNTIALTKKNDEAKKAIAPIQDSLESQKETMKRIFEVSTDEELNEYRQTLFLSSWATEHVTVYQDAELYKGATRPADFTDFFVKAEEKARKSFSFVVAKGDASLLVPDNDKTRHNAVIGTKAWETISQIQVNADTEQTIISKMQEVMKLFAESSYREGDSIVLLLENTANAKTLENFGAELVSIKGKTYYLLTFNEYAWLHQELYKQKDKLKETSVTVKISGKDVVVTKDLLQEMLNGKIEYALRDGNMTSPVEIADKGKPIEKLKDFDLKAFYAKYVQFNSLLLEDAYTDTFKANFSKAFSTLGQASGETKSDLTNWTFITEHPNATLAKTQSYATTMSYNWAKKTNQVSFKSPAEALPEDVQKLIAANPLFVIPFDAMNSPSGDYGTGTGEAINLSKKAKSMLSGKRSLSGKVAKIGDAKLHSGILFETDSVGALYAPSAAFSVSSTQSGNGLLYDVKFGGERGPAVSWRSGEGGTGKPSQVCKIPGENDYYLIKGTQTNGTMFLPVGQSTGTIQLMCSETSASMTVKRLELGKTLVTLPTANVSKESKSGNAIDLGLQTDTAPSVADMMEGIKSGNVCVILSGEKFSLSWNAAKVQ